MITFLAAVGLLIECISFSNLSFLRLVALAPATKEPRGSVEANILLARCAVGILSGCGWLLAGGGFQRFAHRLVLLQIQSANVCVCVRVCYLRLFCVSA